MVANKLNVPCGNAVSTVGGEGGGVTTDAQTPAVFMLLRPIGEDISDKFGTLPKICFNN